MSKDQPAASRREVISLAAGALATTTLLGPATAASAPNRNILIIMTDQEQVGRQLPPLRRPNRDRIAATGLNYVHHYVSNPVCSPSRGSLFTGLYPWQSGVVGNVDIYQNGPPLDPQIPTVGSVFRAQGYETGFFGKWHLSWLVEDPILVEEDYNGGRRDQLVQFGFNTSFIPNDSDDRPLGTRWDGETSRRAAAWIRTAEASGKPWLAVVSLVNPHDIPFAALLAGHKLPDYPITVPRSWNEELKGADLPAELRRGPPQKAPFPAAFGIAPSTEAEWREYIQRYCFLLESTDQHVGTVMDALEESGGRDHTLVVYTSDHGEMAGAHGRTGKGVMYEESVTVPFILSNPRQFPTGRTTEALASNIDVATTVAGWAGVRWPAGSSGVQLLRGDREAVFSISGPKSHMVQMVRSGALKLVKYPSGAEQLFDLGKDPDELQNRARDPALAAQKRDLLARMDREFALPLVKV